MKNIKENKIEQYLIDRVKEMGGETRKVKWIGRRFAPDRLAMFTDYWPVYPELKRPKGGRLSTGQIREHERMRACGLDVRVANTKATVDYMLANLRRRA